MFGASSSYSRQTHNAAARRASALYARRSRSRAAPMVRSVPRPIRGSGTAAQAIRVGGWANPTQRGELKYIDVTNTVAITAAASTVFGLALLNGVAPGSTAITRIGRKVTWKSINLRYTFSLAATTTGGSPLRILVVYDKQPNATAPTVTDVLVSDDFESLNQLANRERFVTIFDHLTDPIAANGDYSVSGQLYKKLNLETIFNAGAAGTVGDMSSGSIYIMMFQNGKLLTANVECQYSSRMRFIDN